MYAPDMPIRMPGPKSFLRSAGRNEVPNETATYGELLDKKTAN
jgi:hypothetical protein